MPPPIQPFLRQLVRSFVRQTRTTLLTAVPLLCPLAVQAQTSSAGEDEIRAAMISHLPAFVEWPAGKGAAGHPAFNLCMLGSDPLRAALEAQFRNKTVLSLPVVIQKVTPHDRMDACHILYVSSASKNELPRLLPALEQASVLVVSERPLSTQKGQVVGLPIEEDHIRIEINLGLAQSSKLIISSRLLHLASVVAK